MLSSHAKRAASAMAALALVSSACGGQLSGDSATAASGTVALHQSHSVDVDENGFLRRGLTAVPPVLVGPYGSSDVSKYLELDAASLAAFPQVDDVPIQRWEYGFLRIRNAEHLVATARLAIRGEIVAFGLPRFNSDTGGYWTPALHEETGVVDVANEVWREVQVRVTEVLGDALDTGVRPGDTIVFISRGGQIRVDPADVSEAAGNRTVPEGEEAHAVAPSVPFVVQSTPPVDLTKGEDVLLLLDWNKFKGLYEGSYGYRFELMPANEILYKYVIQRDAAVNVGDPEGPLTMSLEALQELIDAKLGTAAGEPPRPGVFPADPHPPVDPAEGSLPDDIDEPDHTHGE